MADKLTTYNLALNHLGERRLSALTEAREPRRALDDIWATEVAYCLERKFWNFTYRSVLLDASTSVVPSFGFKYAFTIPADWVRTRRLSASETFDPPLLQFAEEAGYWFTNVDPIYVQFASNDPTFGMDLSLWPASFTDYVACRLARQACVRVRGSADLLYGPQGLIKTEEKAYKVAAANCAMNEPVGFAPMTGWVRARRATGLGGDFPTGGSLIG